MNFTDELMIPDAGELAQDAAIDRAMRRHRKDGCPWCVACDAALAALPARKTPEPF